MLVVTRKPGQEIVIGDDIRISILGIKKNRVNIGVEAPKGIAVHRQEIYELIKRSKDEVGNQGIEEGEYYE